MATPEFYVTNDAEDKWRQRVGSSVQTFNSALRYKCAKTGRGFKRFRESKARDMWDGRCAKCATPIRFHSSEEVPRMGILVRYLVPDGAGLSLTESATGMPPEWRCGRCRVGPLESEYDELKHLRMEEEYLRARKGLPIPDDSPPVLPFPEAAPAGKRPRSPCQHYGECPPDVDPAVWSHVKKAFYGVQSRVKSDLPLSWQSTPHGERDLSPRLLEAVRKLESQEWRCGHCEGRMSLDSPELAPSPDKTDTFDRTYFPDNYRWLHAGCNRAKAVDDSIDQCRRRMAEYEKLPDPVE